MSLGNTLTLNTGAKIPQRGYGTWQAKPGEVEEGVFQALKAGYRHLDLARIYRNQREVAQALQRAYKELGLERKDIFIVWLRDSPSRRWILALISVYMPSDLEIMEQLYLMHWPVAFKTNKDIFKLFPTTSENPDFVEIDDDISIVDTWRAMIELPKSKVRAIGVSNSLIEYVYSPQESFPTSIEVLIKATGIVPAVNQVERHPTFPDPDLCDYCAKKGILITCYSALGNNLQGVPLAIERQEVKDVAAAATKRLGQTVTPAQVVLAWAESGGHITIPKSVNSARIRENFVQVELAAEEMEAINQLGKQNKRLSVPYKVLKPRWPINIFKSADEVGAPHQVNC
ncbi:hypothetical protein CLAIMM_04511 [Cladophialophora immunda]|nr:hypothetical protein CLAIMM_04511 [Cladophialophora immunda]